MRVKATDMSMRLNIRIKELHRIASPGEEFDVSPMRYEILSGKNAYKAVFVTLVTDKNAQVEDIDDVQTEDKPKKRNNRKPKDIVEEVDDASEQG